MTAGARVASKYQPYSLDQVSDVPNLSGDELPGAMKGPRFSEFPLTECRPPFWGEKRISSISTVANQPYRSGHAQPKGLHDLQNAGEACALVLGRLIALYLLRLDPKAPRQGLLRHSRRYACADQGFGQIFDIPCVSLFYYVPQDLENKWATRSLLYTRATCSSVGSAQQYQGSVRYGMVARAGHAAHRESSPLSARSQILRKISRRPAPLALLALDGLLNGAAERVQPAVAGSATGSTGRADRRARSCARTSGSSSSSEPSGISRRIGKLDGRHLAGQVQFQQRAQEFAVALARGPRREGDERGRHRQARRRASARALRRNRRACGPWPASPAPRRRAIPPRDVTNRQPVSFSTGSRSRCFSRCSTLMVTS